MTDVDDPAGSRPQPPLKIMPLRRADACRCGAQLAAGERAAWDRTTRTVVCLQCASGGARPGSPDVPAPIAPASEPLIGNPSAPTTPVALDIGVAGGSAQHEFERRHARRKARVRTAHPKLGGLILALSDDPQSTRAWQSGALGERRLADKLADLGDAVIALHDRRVPKSRANIDHIVIGPTGVYVVDAKRYRNAKISIRRSGGLLSPRREQLIVGGRDKTKLATGMQWQVNAVRVALATSDEFRDVPVVPVLCFIDGELPLFGTLELGDVQIRGLRGTAKLVSVAGPFDAAARDRLARHLADSLPAKNTP